jgi:hypothetical protein
MVVGSGGGRGVNASAVNERGFKGMHRTSRRMVKTRMGPKMPPMVAARGLMALEGGFRDPPGSSAVVTPLMAWA